MDQARGSLLMLSWIPHLPAQSSALQSFADYSGSRFTYRNSVFQEPSSYQIHIGLELSCSGKLPTAPEESTFLAQFR